MDWKEGLQKGKFRDSEFFTESVENAVGRRTELHEYPLRDKPFAEDMGRKAREFTVECFVIGDDYMEQRDKFVEELEKPGAGTLIHPYWGTQNVQVLTVRIRESSDEGRMARFSIEFVESGENNTPAETLDTASIVEEKADAGILASISDFTGQFGVTGMPEFVVTDAVSMVESAMDAIELGQGAIAAVQEIRDNAVAAINNPLKLAQDVTGAIAENSGLDSLKNLHQFGSNLATLAQTTPSRLIQSQNRTAIVNLVRSAAVFETARQLV